MGKLDFDRKVGESVMVGDNVEVVVLRITPGRVTLSFQAPNEVKIHRTEIWQRIRQQGEQPVPRATERRRRAS